MAISLDNVTFLNGSREVISNFSYKFKGDGITTFLGNDDLKYLLRIFKGLEKPKHGKVGNDHVDIGYFSFEMVFDLDMTVVNYFKLNVNKKDNLFQRQIEMLDSLGLNENYLLRKIKSLSSSEKVMVMLANLFLNDYSLLLLDFSTMYWDGQKRVLLVDKIKMISKIKKMDIIIITKDIDFAYEVSDNLVIMKNGKLIVSFAKKDILEHIGKLKENEVGLPKMIEFIETVKHKKGINLNYCDDINELVKEVSHYV